MASSLPSKLINDTSKFEFIISKSRASTWILDELNNEWIQRGISGKLNRNVYETNDNTKI